jgi:hypothetical protein
MNEITVSAVLVVPSIRGGQQRIKGLVPAMRLQQLRLQGNEYGQAARRGLTLPFGH